MALNILSWTFTALFLMPCGYQCLSAHILNEEPVHVLPGSSLVLNAQIQHGPLEELSLVTWEREPEAGNNLEKLTLATCSGTSLTCSGKTLNGRVSVEQRGAILKLEGFTRMDSGVYGVTITDRTGAKTTAQCIVREYEAVHHVSVSINVSHSFLVCGEAWGTEPHFRWLYERAVITNAVGSVSKDGKTLVVSSMPMCGHFTCMVSNKLGYSSATYTAEPCHTRGSGVTVGVVCLVLLLLLGGALASLLWRRHRRLRNAGERLHEHFDDNI